MRLIDEDALIKELSTMYKEPTSTEDFLTIGYDKAIADVVVTVHQHPTADVRANVKGKWIVGADGMIHCSNCDIIPTSRIIIDEARVVFDMAPIKKRMLFCPNCGAEMER